MKLPFFSSSQSSKDVFFGLFLKEKRGIGYIISGDKGVMRVLGKREFLYSNGWENLVQDIDELLFKLEDETKCRIEKTIFFVFSHLIEEKTKEIKKPYLQKIKEITKTLEIKPIGYIECQDAVVSFLQERDGAPLSSILIELDDTFAGIFIYKGGHKIHSFIVSRTDNIIDDIVSVFDSLGKTLLPNRVILYNSGNLSHESGKIISYRWSSDLFVQLPRVEILKEDNIQEGLLHVFADQTYQKNSGTFVHEEVKAKEVLGFMIATDVKNSADRLEQEYSMPETKQQKTTNQLQGGNSNVKMLFQTIQKKTKHISTLLTSISIRPKKSYMIFIGLLSSIVVLIFCVEYLFHRADLTLVLATKTIKKDLNIKALLQTNKVGFLPIFVATSSTKMKDVKITTGKRDVGEMATGEVTLFNFDDEDKSFAKGTIIEVDNMKFSLNEEVRVAASTLAQDASAKLPGKKNVKVTALDIGTESNIDKGKRFKIEDLSLSVFFAMNDEAFSGGTKKSIKTVSKKDLEDLKNQILEKSKRQQQETIKKQIAKQVNLVEPLMKVSLDDMKYSKELGEEGDNVSLEAKVIAQYYYYESQDMISVLKNSISKEIPPGYDLIDTNLSHSVLSVKDEDEEINLKVKVEARAGKKIDTSIILADISGKTKTATANILNSNTDINSHILIITPNILVLKEFTPFFRKNIHIVLEYK